VKIRQQFVSNSSSSSFVAVLPQKKYQEIIDDLLKSFVLTEEEVDFVETPPVAQDGDSVMVQCGYTEDGLYVNNEYFYYDDESCLSDCVDSLEKALRENTKLYCSEYR